MIMSNHVTGGVSTAATDTTALHFNPRKRRDRYNARKDLFLSELERYVVPESWRGVRAKIEGASDESLEQAEKHVAEAVSKGLDADTWFALRVQTKKRVREVVLEILRNLNHKGNSTGIGTTVENNPGADTDMAADSGIQPIISVLSLPPPQPPSPSPSAPPQPEANPDPRPQKRQKLSDGQYIDITDELSSEKEEQLRKSLLGSVDERAQRIISQLTNDERLNDDTIDIVSKTLELSLPSPKSAIKILDTMRFRVDEKTIPPKLKNDPNRDEDIYAPLHHSSPRHWTLCVLSFESNYKVDSEPESVSQSICIDFYDSSEDKTRREDVETFFNKWIKHRHPECRSSFNSKKSAQQADGTSCGIFVLETIRRLIGKQDVTRTIKPMEARKDILGMINSLDTTSLPPSTTLQVIERIQVLRNNCNKSAIMAVSPSPTQQPQSMLSSQYIITQIEAVMAREGTSITDQLPRAQEKCRQLAEQEQRLESELKHAEKELAIAIIKEEAFEEVSRTVAESTRADDTVNPWLAGVGRRAREYENTPLANDDRNTHGEKARSGKDGVLLDRIHSLVQEAVQAELDDRNERITKDLKKILRAGSERVESAKKKVDGLKELLEGVKAEKLDMDSIVGVCLGLLSGLRQKCGGETKVP